MLLLDIGAPIIGLVVVLGACVYSIVRERRADRRAAELLSKLLDPMELAWLHTLGYLEVPSRSTPGRRCRIPEQPGFVTVMDSGVPVMYLCSQPTTTIPAAEYVLVHKILLEGAEEILDAREPLASQTRSCRPAVAAQQQSGTRHPVAGRPKC